LPANDIINSAFLSCKSLLAAVVSRIVPPHEIEDIVQETYVRVCQSKVKGELREPRAFMVKTARNLALDHIKRAEQRLNGPLDFQTEQDLAARDDCDPYRQSVSDQEFARFCEAVRLLPLQCRRVFVLKKVYGHSQREIAKKLGLKESTVEKHIARGIMLCARHLALDAPSGTLTQRESSSKTKGVRR
jgi:RNA polymerase sigma-70 factor (ECF subfamily)